MAEIIGLDLAGTNCGVCNLFSSKRGDSQRITGEGQGVTKLYDLVGKVAEHVIKRNPRLVVLEDLLNNPFSYKGGDLAQTSGALRFALYKTFPILLVNPSKVKHFVCTKKSSKWEVSKSAIEMFQWKPVSVRKEEIMDEMDAVILAHIGWWFFRISLKESKLEDLTPWQQEIFWSKNQVKVRKGKTIEYVTGLLQRPDLLIGAQLGS